MALPASLLLAIEEHACFSGCYSHETPVSLCIDPVRAPVAVFHAKCQDCLLFYVGALRSILPSGMTHYTLAQELSAHIRAVRGYRWAFSGYHASGAGFWLSVAYYGDGLFLVDGSRNHGGAKDVDLLVQAFRARLAMPDDPGMLDPALYACDTVHISCAPPLGPVKTKADILRLQQCSLAPRQGFQRVSIVEFLPFTTRGVSGAKAAPSTVTAAAQSATKGGVRAWLASDVGEMCHSCGKTVKPLTICGKTEYNCMC